MDKLNLKGGQRPATPTSCWRKCEECKDHFKAISHSEHKIHNLIRNTENIVKYNLLHS